MSRFFVSYRRGDSQDVTDHICDRLYARFGRGNVFRDIDSIPLGHDFRKVLAEKLDQCDVLLAVIGEHWLDSAFEDGPSRGQRRLDDPDDFVRIEIESALAREIPVVPLLVKQALLPREAELPAALKHLASRQAAAVRSGADFDDHVNRLIRGLEELVAIKQRLDIDLDKALAIADTDPGMALTRGRMVLDSVVRGLYERRFHEPPGTRTPESLIRRLDQARFLPEGFDVAALRRKLAEGLAAHRSEALTAAEAHALLAELDELTRWYIDHEQPGSFGAEIARVPEPPRPDPATRAPAHEPAPERIAVVPKGLRSFDAGDSEFFLQLLPGPRDNEGLPESLRFWKLRIETPLEPEFTVGVIYGPSGCGKSSLIKAGLLPRLQEHIITVYVEAALEETETRLLNRLQQKIPRLARDLGLVGSLAALRRGEGLLADQKVLIVVDQFEQWLHAMRREVDPELTRALRQCDGEHAQCIVMVRDDFWVALSRFMADLHIEILQGRNAALVDLFDTIHARRVLEDFGRAYERLPGSGRCWPGIKKPFWRRRLTAWPRMGASSPCGSPCLPKWSRGGCGLRLP